MSCVCPWGQLYWPRVRARQWCGAAGPVARQRALPLWRCWWHGSGQYLSGVTAPKAQRRAAKSEACGRRHKGRRSITPTGIHVSSPGA